MSSHFVWLSLDHALVFGLSKSLSLPTKCGQHLRRIKESKGFDEAGGGLVGEGEERGEGVDAESFIYRPILDKS